MNDADDWNDPYGDEQAYYGGWSREDVESGLLMLLKVMRVIIGT